MADNVLACENQLHGCPALLHIDTLNQHITECEYNPKKPVVCQSGCGLIIPKDELNEHNCVNELHSVIKKQGKELTELRHEFNAKIVEHRQELSVQRHEINLLKEYLNAIKSPIQTSNLQAVQQRLQCDDIMRWTQTLSNAIVMRWGGVISTPDVVLQTIMRRALIDTGCPMRIVSELMENAHERRWPPGLNTLETRQLNRRHYDGYIAKRIPGKQAIVILHCENQHMGDDMIISPGIVIIFAHGVEDTA